MYKLTCLLDIILRFVMILNPLTAKNSNLSGYISSKASSPYKSIFKDSINREQHIGDCDLTHHDEYEITTGETSWYLLQKRPLGEGFYL